MFKSAIIYRIGDNWTAPEVADLQAVLESQEFEPCTPSQAESVGWAPPRGIEHGPLVENVSGRYVLKFVVERKVVPGPALKAELEAACKEIETTQGRKPGKKERAELKEDIKFKLLSRAFSKKSAHLVLIDPKGQYLIVGASSHKGSDPIVNRIVDCMADAGRIIPLRNLSTEMTASAGMSQWLTSQEAPHGFTVDRELELKSSGEDKATIKYARHTLELEEIIEHIKQGKVPQSLGMTWDSKLSFLLTSALTLKKLQFSTQEGEEGVDEFDADVTLAAGGFSGLVPDLIDALGGELIPAE